MLPLLAGGLQGRLEVFAAGPDGNLGHMWQQTPGGDDWSAWGDLGPEIVGRPAVFQNADGRLEVFTFDVHGNLGHIWQTSPSSGPWSSWYDLGATVRSEPAVFQNADGRLEVFAIGPDGNLGHMWQMAPASGPWSAWGDLGPAIQSVPSVFQNADGRLEVFAFGPDLDSIGDGSLGHAWQMAPASGPWSEWGAPAPTILSQTNSAVFQNADGRLEVFFVDPESGSLGHIWQEAPSSGPWAWDWFWGTEITSDPAVF